MGLDATRLSSMSQFCNTPSLESRDDHVMTNDYWIFVRQAAPASSVLIGTVSPMLVGERAEPRRRHSGVDHTLWTQPGRRGLS